MLISSRYVIGRSNLRKQNLANDLTARDSSPPFTSVPLPIFFRISPSVWRLSLNSLFPPWSRSYWWEFSFNIMVEYFLVWFRFVWNGHCVVDVLTALHTSVVACLVLRPTGECRQKIEFICLYRVARSWLTHFEFEYCADAIACRGWREGEW